MQGKTNVNTNKKVVQKKPVKKQVKKITKKTNLKDKQISIFSIIFVVLIIAVIVGLYIGIRNLIITLKYKEYTEKMNTYGYNVLYENQKATAVQKFTNMEMLQVVTGSIRNMKVLDSSYNKDGVDDWKTYLKDLGMLTEEYEKKLKDRATKIDVAIYAVNVIETFLDETIEPTELKMSDKKLAKYTADEKTYIAKAVTLGLIKNNNSALSNKKLVKGELNKITIELVEKYSTLYYKAEETGGKLVLDNNKKPSNYKEYPYIVDNIPNEIYELPHDIVNESKYYNALYMYKYYSDLYGQIDQKITEYFDTILNVDYAKIDTEEFLENLNANVVYRLEEEDVAEYIKYVKDNKIKLEGKAEVLLPIAYGDGEQYRVRTKLTFKVLNSNTDTNLLFGDGPDKVDYDVAGLPSYKKQNIKYDADEIIMYVDVTCAPLLNANTLNVYVSCQAESMCKQNTSVILEEIME